MSTSKSISKLWKLAKELRNSGLKESEDEEKEQEKEQEAKER